jgi:hypothetical protein
MFREVAQPRQSQRNPSSCPVLSRPSVSRSSMPPMVARSREVDMRRRTTEEWKKLLRELDPSGLSQAGFAEQRVISVATLHCQPMRPPQSSESELPWFVEVRVSPAASRSSRSLSDVEVRTGHHVRVQCEGRPDVTWLAALVRELGRT